MSAVKIVVAFVVVCALFNVVLAKPTQKRHQRSEPPQNGYFSEYQLPSNYQPVPMYQSYPRPYYPMPPPMPYPMPPQSYQPYPYYMPYNYYPPMYPMYPSYPIYQPYSFQPQPQNYYSDPYAGVPVEIIDVDSDDANDANVDIESSHKANATGLNEPIKTTNVVTTKPIQAVITRIFDDSKPEPEIKVETSNSDSVKPEESKPNADKEKTDKDKTDKKASKNVFSFWG